MLYDIVLIASVSLSVCPLCYLLLNRWTKFNQIWCVSYSHEWGVQRQFFLAPPPGALGRGQKVKYFISITRSISKIFIPNFVCVVQMKYTKHIRQDFHSVTLVMPQGWDFGELGCPGGGGGVNIFSKHGHVAYQIDRDDEQNRMQVKFSSYGQNGDLGVRSKGQISFNFGLHVNFKDIYTKLCVCCTNEIYKTYQTGFSFCYHGHAPGVGLWGAGGAQGGGVNFFFQTWSCGISNRQR